MDPGDGDLSSTSTDNVSPIQRNRHIAFASNWAKGRLLGQGSYGSIYLMFCNDGFSFAVKEVCFLDQDVHRRQNFNNFEQAISLLSTFEHENIVKYYGTYKEETTLYIFLELASRGSLLNLYRHYHLIDAQASAYTREILLGLKYLHDKNVVHRNIKCANILFDTTGTAKLSDFGSAKAIELNYEHRMGTAQWMVWGTAHWMAPEIVRGSDYGPAADIWSLGCTVLEMITGQFPYCPLDVMQAVFRIGTLIPPHVPDSISKDARDFILKCLQLNPTSRPTASQLLDHPFVKERLPSSSDLESPHNPR